MKHCSRCKTDKPESEFHKNRATKDGLYGFCKPCSVKAAQEWQKKNPERAKKSAREYRKNNKEKVAKRTREYRKKNIEKVRKWRRDWSKAHPEYTRAASAKARKEHPRRNKEHQRKYAQNNKDKMNAKTRKYRARKKFLLGSHTKEDIEKIRKSQNNKCFWCDRKVKFPGHIDHVVPITRGGANSPENLVLACEFCNKSKGSKLPHEWKPDKYPKAFRAIG